VQSWLIKHPELQIAVLRGREVVATRTLPSADVDTGGSGLMGRFRRTAPGNGPAYWIGAGGDEGAQVQADSLGGRENFALVSRDREGRCVLHLLPGMEGELNVGVCSISIERLLRDPAVQARDGSADYALPNGTRVNIECGGLQFVMSYGGAPLFAEASQPAVATARLATQTVP
jgi:hypothetical protein